LETIIQLVLARLELLSTQSTEGLSSVDLVQQGFCDPVRVFVKGEPHPIRKEVTNRWRLIFAISIVDQIIERLLCTTQNKEEIKTWMDHPSAPGLGLSDDTQLDELYERVIETANGKPFAEADVSGWDWSVQEWELLHEAELRIKLGNFPLLSATCLRSRFYCVTRTVYAMPDGSLLELLSPGVQLSGCFNTSSTNSRLRVLAAYLVGAAWAIAMGDDCVEDFVADALERYAALGHPLKMYVLKTIEFEFCSNIFSKEGAWPVDGTKTLFRLLEQKNITPELLFQFRMEMRNHPRKAEFLASVERVKRAGKETLNIS
jgi:hypothetical protein